MTSVQLLANSPYVARIFGVLVPIKRLRNDRGWRVGEWHGKAKYSDAQVRALRADYRPGVRGHGMRTVASRHGVAYETARDILRGATRTTA